MRKSLAGLLVLAFAALASGGAAAADEIGFKSKLEMCVGCHGIPNYRSTFPAVYHVPKLGGQKADYLANALKAYRSGERNHPTMRSIAVPLSDADIEQFAKYYAGE